MKTLQFKKRPPIISSLLACIITAGALVVTSQVYAQIEQSPDEAGILATQVLNNTQTAIRIVNKDPESSLRSIKNALASLENIELLSKLDEDYSNERVDKSLASDANGEEYPKLSPSVLKNEDKLPTLYSKVQKGILYDGAPGKITEGTSVYFDTPFAKASLETAQNAIRAGDFKEACRSLNRVFEAVYISPKFVRKN